LKYAKLETKVYQEAVFSTLIAKSTTMFAPITTFHK